MTGYEFFLAVHILAVLLAYGLPLAYPLMLPWLRRNHPRAMPGVHEVQHRLNRILTGPGTLLVLGAGIYLASKADAWDEPFVGAGFVAVLIIGGVGGWVVGASDRMAKLAAADVAAAGPDGPVTWSDEYEDTWKRYESVERLLGLVVLVTVVLMAVKP
jgi:hypothetical protein